MPNLPPEILANIAGRRLNINQQKDTGLQQLGQQYNTNLTNLDEYSSEGTRRINDQYAAQGIADSGIRVDEQGRLQKNVGQRRGMLGQQYAQGQSGIQSQYENAIQALNEYQNEQMLGQTRTDLDTQLRQQQIAAQNAATMQAASAAQMGSGGGGAVGGPNEADLSAWYAEAQRQQDAINLWNATLMYNAQQDQLLKQYHGGVGKVM